jgi:AcrR family transcriptional regulator
MPPRVKFKKEQIVETALAIAKKEGYEGISIRKVADRLGCSIAPIYVNFETVEDLKEEVMRAIVTLGNRMVEEAESGHPFRDIGVASLRFASEYPVLFSEMILHRNTYLKDYSDQADEGFIDIMQGDPDLQGIDKSDLRRLLVQMRAFQTGLGVMIANGSLPPDLDSDDQLHMLEEVATALIAKLKMKGDISG